MAWFAARGTTTRRVLSDKGSAYRSHAWRETCTELGIAPERTGPTARGPTARSKREVAGLRWTNEILKAASAAFAVELGRPSLSSAR